MSFLLVASHAEKETKCENLLKWFNKISYFMIMIIACVQWNSLCNQNVLFGFQKIKIVRSGATNGKSSNNMKLLFINKPKKIRAAVKRDPDNRFPFSSSLPPALVWYFIVDNARGLQSRQLLAEQWKIKLKWALDWLWLVSCFFMALPCSCTMAIEWSKKLFFG